MERTEEDMGENDRAQLQADMVAAVLPPALSEEPPARKCGLAGWGQAHLLDAAKLIRDEWEAMTAASIEHCWVKSKILPVTISASVVSAHAEYKGGFDSVGQDVEAVLALLRSTTLGADAFSGESAGDVRNGVVPWFAAEDGEQAILDTAELLSTVEASAPGN